MGESITIKANGVEIPAYLNDTVASRPFATRLSFVVSGFLCIGVLALSCLVLSGCSNRRSTEMQRISAPENNEENVNMKMKMTIGTTILTATLADNSSARALQEMLKEGPVTIVMQDYASMEKVGPLGKTLPRNDRQTTTEAGDLILYQGNKLVIYYETNSWNFTRLGKIDGIGAAELKDVLGSGDVSVVLSLD